MLVLVTMTLARLHPVEDAGIVVLLVSCKSLNLIYNALGVA